MQAELRAPIVSLVLAAVAGAAALDATPAVRFQRLSIDEGLSQSTVNAIEQDSRGLLWLGTDDGLNIFDGYEFTLRTHDPQQADTLSGNAVYALQEDVEGRTWVATWAGGVNRYDPATDGFRRYRHDPAEPTSLASDRVHSLLLDSRGDLWVGMEDGRLDRYDAATDSFEHVGRDAGGDRRIPAFAVRAIVEDGAGALWVGTEGGGVTRLGADRAADLHLSHEPAAAASPSSDRVTALLVDGSGALWLGTAEGGLDRFDAARGEWRRYGAGAAGPLPLGSTRVTALHEDGEGWLWIGTEGRGLFAFEPESGRVLSFRHRPGDPQSLSADGVLAIREDSSGILWIGTDGGGVNKTLRGAARFRSYRHDPTRPDGLSDSFVYSLLEDGRGRLWVGTWAGGINRFDAARETVTRFAHDPSDPRSLPEGPIYGLAEAAGRIWVATGRGGLAAIDPESDAVSRWEHDGGNPLSPASNRLRVVVPAADGTLWLGTDDAGLDGFDPAGKKILGAGGGLPAGKIYAICEDSRGRLWVGVEGGGLARLDPGAAIFVHYEHDPEDPSSLGHDDVMTVVEDRSGAIWVGTHGGGLDRWVESSDGFEHYRMEDGLPNNVVYGILEDGAGRLWLSTNRGLSRFDPRTGAFTNFDTSDGLASLEFNSGAYFTAPSGEMFFGGIAGFSSFFPSRIEPNTHRPAVTLTEFRKLGQKVVGVPAASELREIVLGPSETAFTLQFAALDYTAPARNRYAYKLEGFDEDWTNAGHRRDATYTNLDPGRYTFRVRASNNDGVWNDEGLVLAVTVQPPIWATVWFRGLAASIVVLAVFAGHRLRLRTERRRNLELEAWNEKLEREVRERRRAERERERLIAELEAANAELTAFTNTVSHDLRSPLLTIQGFTMRLVEDLAAGKPRELAADVGHITTAAAHMKVLLDDLLELSRVGTLELAIEDVTVDEAVRSALRIAGGRIREAGAEVVVKASSAVVRADHTRLVQVIQNLVENAVKFRGRTETPRIEIRAERSGDVVTCAVQDNGAGIEPALQEKIFGLFNQLDPSTEGSGVGLAIVRKIVERHGGRVWVESAGRGRGASFHFTLPAPRSGAPGGRGELLPAKDAAR